MTSTTSGYVLTGNTYALRSEIKSLGGKWDERRKVWIVPAGQTMAERARQGTAVHELRRRGVSVDRPGRA